MNAVPPPAVELDDRNALLQAFSGPREKHDVIPAAQAFGALAERTIGAQAVAVHRDDAHVLQKIKTLAAAAGQDWYYRFPVKNRRENRTDYIEGPSIKLANDLARIYGNCEIDTRVQDLGAEWLIYARFTDVETGFAMVRPFQQRKKQASIGGGDDARALDIALQIGVSKAIRNVVVNALQTYADFAFDEARNALVDKIGKNLEGYRTKVVERLQAKSIDLKRVDAVIGRASSEWLAPDIARVIAMVKSIDDGMATLDETFPPPGGAPQDKAPAENLNEKLDKLAGASGEPAHDPETGEVKDSAKSDERAPRKTRSAKQDNAAKPQNVKADAAADIAGVSEDPTAQGSVPDEEAAARETPREKLINDLRDAMRGGTPILRLLNDMAPEQRALLSDADVAGLKTFWSEVRPA